MKHLCIIFMLLLLCSCGRQTEKPILGNIPESRSVGIDEPSPEPKPVRTYYRYKCVGAEWNEDEAAFPVEWIKAARVEVCAKMELDEAEFKRGWLYDFDRDGREEAVMLLEYWSDRMEGYYSDDYRHFAYVNSDGRAQYLVSGRGRFDDDMEMWLLEYKDFSHMFVQARKEQAMSETDQSIFEIKDGGMKFLTMTRYAYLRKGGDGVFIETLFGLSMAPRIYFWDEERHAYSTIGAIEIPSEEFFAIFEPEKTFVNEEWMWRDSQRLGIDPPNMTPEKFERVEVYGNKYYNLYISKDVCMSEAEYPLYPQVMLWRHEDGRWELHDSDPRYGLAFEDAPLSGVPEEDKVYDVDMDTAEKDAIL